MSDESGGFFGSDSADVGLEDHFNSGIQGNGMSDLMTLEEIQAFPITAKAHIDGLQKHNNTLLDQIEQKDKQCSYFEQSHLRALQDINKLHVHIARLEKVVESSQAINEYLLSNRLNCLGSGSILHRDLKFHLEALNELKGVNTATLPTNL